MLLASLVSHLIAKQWGMLVRKCSSGCDSAPNTITMFYLDCLLNWWVIAAFLWRLEKETVVIVGTC